MKTIARASSAMVLALLPGLALAQGNGGSQTSCELRYSTCKQTAKADYQFCKNASQKNCGAKRDAALRSCTAASNGCQN
jgi:hypothetical protein